MRLKVSSKQEAIHWIKRSPLQEAEVEIRQVFELEDFGEAATPEIRKQEEDQRAQLAAAR